MCDLSGDAAVTEKKGRLFVVAAPSGAGKTSLVRALLEEDPELRMSISFTTRPRRKTEIHGQDYFFVDADEFEALRNAGELLEHARVFDNQYGTSRQRVQADLQAGHNVILEIDWQGARQVRETTPGCTTIFILPPSLEELERRLRGRSTDSDAVIARRLRDARSDISHWAEFDFVVVNEDFRRAVADLHAIVDGEDAGCRTDREDLQPLLNELLARGPAIKYT